MSSTDHSDAAKPEVLAPEVIDADTDGAAEDDSDEINETIDHPAKLVRIDTMLRHLLAEVRAAELDEASRQRLREIYETSVAEVGSALSEDLRDELSRLASPFEQTDLPSATELQIAKAQLVGWLEGLIQGMKAMIFAQQMAAQQQLQSGRNELGPGARMPGHDGRSGPGSDLGPGGGTYL